jgi:hypothetical protein
VQPQEAVEVAAEPLVITASVEPVVQAVVLVCMV